MAGNTNCGQPVKTMNVSWDGTQIAAPTGTAETASIPRTLGAGQALVSQATDRAGDTYWVQSRSALTPAAGTAVTINDTAPARDMWNLTLIEIT